MEPGARRRRARRLSYAAGAGPALVTVPELPFLVLPGRGDPQLDGRAGGPAHAITRLAQVVRFLLRRGRAGATAGWTTLELTGRRDPEGRPEPISHRWSLLVPLPDEVDEDVVDRARHRVRGVDAALLDAQRLRWIDEGLCVQLLGRRPSERHRDLERLDRYVRDRGLLPRGGLHLLYLRDASRPAAARRTIVRQSVDRPDAPGLGASGPSTPPVPRARA